MSATNAEQKPTQTQKRAHPGEENGAADDGIINNKTKKVDNGEIKNDLANSENNLKASKDKASEDADNEAISAEPKLNKKVEADQEGNEESDAESGAVDEEEDDEVLDDDEEDDDADVGAEGDDQDEDDDGGEDDEGEEEEEEEEE